MSRDARVLHVNVGRPRPLAWRGRVVPSGIVKHPVLERVAVAALNLAGDGQADLEVHGGVDKAVYAYAWEDYVHWQQAEGLAVVPGLFGENLTLAGLDVMQARVGERWRVGTAVLEIAQPRLPCVKLGMRLEDAEFPRRFQESGRVGAYLRVVTEGDIGANDVVTIESRPSHDVTLATMLAALRDVDAAARLRAVSYLPPFWQRIAARH